MSTYLTIDPDNRIIEITKVPVGGLSSLDAQIDIFSDLKEDWFSTPALHGLKFPFRTFGDPKTPTNVIGPFVFFNNILGWRFQPYDLDHELTILGNLVPENVTLPMFVSRPGRQILILLEQSAQALTSLNDLISTRIYELWQEKGLDSSNPLTVSATNRSFGSVSQTISGTDTKTVQRD